MGEKFALGISGFAGSGKTTVANYLEQQHGFKRMHIAEPLRAMLRTMMRARGISHYMIDRYLTGDLKDGVVIPEFGVTSRHLQITLGTEWGRDHVSPDLWVDIWKHQASGEMRPMNDSVRFPNEAKAIRALGGIVIRVDRPGIGPGKFKNRRSKALYDVTGIVTAVHPSEDNRWLTPDEVIVNSGTIQDLHRTIDWIVSSHGLGLTAFES